ncbi:MAG: hypothetical protein AB8B55_19765 [Mariniblastus sp.]
MASSINSAVHESTVTKFHTDESGKVTLLASILMLALVSLAGLIGNTGHATTQKLETQNAADSIAYSSTLWMARGMNALTATNHMLGEATAIAAVHEAFGGPELEHGIKRNTSENAALDRIIRSLSPTAPVIPSLYSPPPIPSIDRRVVKFVTDRTSPAKGEMTAFATIYDSRMSLKRQLAVILPAKSFANLGFLVPPPWGYATAAVAYGVHIAGTANIVLIGKEWFVLEALEAIARIFKPMKSVIEKQLVPTLAAHADFVASYDPVTKKAKPGIVNGAVKRAVLDLEKKLEVEASLFPKFEKLRLPVVPEPKPNMRGSTQPTQGWGSDKPPIFPMPDLNSAKMQRKLNRAMGDMQKRIETLRRDLDDLDDFESDIEKRLSEEDVSAAEKTKLNSEKAAIEKSRQSKQKRIAEVELKLSELRTQRAELEQAINQPLPDQSDNPSVKSIPRQMNQRQERYTQWVRATYPQSDSFRAPIRAWLKQWAPKSKSADHFDKWTNRYTLVKAWQFRSGFRTQKSGNQVAWRDQKKPLHMFVMRDAFRGSRDRKGYENWTKSDATSKREAEKLFTLIGVAHRDYQPLFSETLYPAPAKTGITCYAQAIFYNANRQQAGSGRQQTQQKIGWDTLNWDESIAVPEWGSPAHESSPKWPWEAFDGSTQGAVAKVKLNWQAKLMPCQTKRIKDAAVTLSGNARKNLDHAADHFDKLGNH